MNLHIHQLQKISGKNFFQILLENGDFLQNLKITFTLFNSQEINNHTLQIGDYQIVIPYLNGGLFRLDTLEENLEISLKNKEWKSIFEFLNNYNWIIENIKGTEETEDKVLTPEILGHVYERSVVEWERIGFKKDAEMTLNKITERKKLGVYYTPEHITEFISNNTIIPFLLDKLENRYNTFEDFIIAKNKEDLQNALNILDNIKILDPACGSSSFLIKASEILLSLKRRIYYELRVKKPIYDLKLDIITNNIYGVDILAGAIEISKLRLWLWLIADFEDDLRHIQPLPNIEYNLKVGNSLFGWLDEKLDHMTINFIPNEINDMLKDLIERNENSEDIKNLKLAKELLEKYNLNDYTEAYYILYNIYRKTHGLIAEKFRKTLSILRNSIYSSINPSFLDYINSKIDMRYNKLRPPINKEEFSKLEVFHWRIDFGHIINGGGFDIVIGNPPYGNLLNEIQKRIIKKSYDKLQGEGASEVAGLFLYRSTNITKDKGYLSFIITFAITFNKDLSSVRFHIKNNFKEIYISTFDRDSCRIFSSMTQSVSIIFCNKKLIGEGKILTSKFFRETPNFDKIEYTRADELLLIENKIKKDFSKKHRLPKLGPKNVVDILKKILLNTNKFKDIINYNDKKINIYYRTSGNYWYNAWEFKPYKSSKIKEISVPLKYKDFILLLINSNLFYLFLRIYGDGRDLNLDILNAMPIPKYNLIDNKIVQIEKVATDLMKKLRSVFDKSHNRFIVSKAKSIIDQCDYILKDIYNLNYEEYKFLIEYDKEIRKKV